ncbi:cysteine hydrolase family protein [Sphingomonas colocasiae]|uniref:Cysteine hydrolase n=1 Tax=Sphingomonas colocasiae TaxID=1848973 RepID=A0ABS7PVW0_9SPHN|nr:cysteine hydrolase [Sphingomonas colocasiae]
MTAEPRFARLPRRAETTTLLFVDMQRIWIDDATGYYHDRLHGGVLHNQQSLLRAARGAGVQVMHTIIESLTSDGRDRSMDHKLSDIHVPRGHPSGAIIDSLAPVENEIVLPKTSSGLFNSTPADYVLRNLGTTHLVVCGVITDQCVDMAARDAADRGYLVTVVDDACATYTPERHAAAIRTLGGYADILDTAAAIEHLFHLPPAKKTL